MGMIELRTEVLELPLVHEFTIARGSESTSRSVVVRLDWNGISALGESAPIERYAESVGSVQAALAAHRLGRDPYALDAQLAGLAPAARCGLDVALHDLIGKDLERPLYALLGLEAQQTPRTSFTLGIAPIADTLAKVRAVGSHPILKTNSDTAPRSKRSLRSAIVTRARSASMPTKPGHPSKACRC